MMRFNIMILSTLGVILVEGFATPINRYVRAVENEECGTVNSDLTPLVINGKQYGRYPWQVGIYLDGNHICSGTILSPNVVVTSAVCFEHSRKRYKIATGKFYRAYNDSRDINAQYSNITEINIHDGFFDGEFLRNDIAILILETALKITDVVRPVCIDLNNFSESSLVNKTGVVAGWGYTTENGNPSEVLKTMNVKFLSRKECNTKLPPDFRRYFALDKLCTENIDKSNGICQGDLGGALIFKRGARYYMEGFVSIGPFKINAACDMSKPTLHTSFSYYKQFITKYLL